MPDFAVDLLAVAAVQSALKGTRDPSTRDPWADEVIRRFADVFIYADKVLVPSMVSGGIEGQDEWSGIHELLCLLHPAVPIKIDRFSSKECYPVEYLSSNPGLKKLTTWFNTPKIKQRNIDNMRRWLSV